MLSHACGAAFDNPDLIVAAVVGDGEAETGPLATSWHINKFLNPVRDGAVLPILHLNGYKINNPTLLARISHEELEDLFRGYGWTPYFVEGSDPDSMHQAMAATLEQCISEIRNASAGSSRHRQCRASALADDRAAQPEGLERAGGGGRTQARRFWRAHQVPLADVKKDPAQLADARELDARAKAGGTVRRKRQAYPGAEGTCADRRPRAWAPIRTRTAGLLKKTLRLPDFRDYAPEGRQAREHRSGEHAAAWDVFLRDVMKREHGNFPCLRSGREHVE